MDQFEINNGELISYIGNDSEIIIPDDVNTIGKCAFANNNNIAKINLNKVNSIDEYAFYNCKNLIQVENIDDCRSVSKTAFVGCPLIQQYILKSMMIEELIGKDFLIQQYQRGYRWTDIEVEDLLNDLYYSNSEYCLQPLVVKKLTSFNYISKLYKDGIKRNEDSKEEKIESISYEIVDGQQRLTTLFLILSQIYSGEIYNVYYSNERPIDNEFIKSASDTIRKWFDKNKKINKDEFKNKIINGTYFIWYELVIDNIKIEEEFRNINAGQIPLTNAELFKAMLLNDEIIASSSKNIDLNRRDIYKMAFDWDELEKKLQNKELWAFLSNSDNVKNNRLDYLFELCAFQIIEEVNKDTKRQNEYTKYFKNLNPELERFSYLAIHKYLEYETNKDPNSSDNKKEIKFESVKLIWDRIKDIYSSLMKMYEDNEIYNYLGFLVCCDRKKSKFSLVPKCVRSLYLEMANVKNDYTNNFKFKLKKLVYEQLKSHIEEATDKTKIKSIFIGKNQDVNPDYYLNNTASDIRDFLLFFNVWSVKEGRFPFEKYRRDIKEEKGWDIEHISARDINENIKEELDKLNEQENRKQYINDLIAWMKLELQDDKLKEKLYENMEEQEFIKKWKEFCETLRNNEDNSIRNLALLDSNTNRSYANALFLRKRNEIIERDKQGRFIPIATKNAFLKYYTENPDATTGWTDKDKNGYLEEIKQCIDDLKKMRECENAN